MSTQCIHCGNPVGVASLSGVAYFSERFCCRGCETVYEILHSRGLDRYYELKKKGESVRPPLPAAEAKEKFLYLDDPEFQKLYAMGNSQMQFYLEGVHCVACIWLIEKVPEFLPGVQSVHLNMSQAVATVNRGGVQFSEIAQEFNRLGYKPHPVRSGDVDALQKKENRRFLVRVGIAWAASANVFLYAVCLYAGVSGEFARRFRWFSFFFFVPSLLYSAIPFYKSAWSAFRTRTVSIDIPIVLGIVVGSCASFYNLATGSEYIYFDSLASLIFLLLASRYLLRITQQTALNASGLLHFLAPSMVRRRNPDGSIEETSAEFLGVGDRVLVYAGESIPVDGTVCEGETQLNCALLTGESDWVKVQVGDSVFAGTTNQQSPIEVRVSASGATTRLGQILKATEEGMSRKAPLVALADQVSKWVVLFAIVLAFFTFVGVGVHQSWNEGMNRAMAIMIITCPCALALATPLAMMIAMGRAAKQGLLIKGGDVIERLSRVNRVYLDKTGTLTSGTFEVLAWQAEPMGTKIPELAEVIVALESRSVHPVAKALVRYFQSRCAQANLVEMTDFKETLGQGVFARHLGTAYEIRKWEGPLAIEATAVAVYREGHLLGKALLGDRVREDSEKSVRKLSELGLVPYILSGDGESAVKKVAAILGIPLERAIYGLSPEEKSQRFTSTDAALALMVGDGANDAVALGTAFVGVAAHGGMEVSLRAADAYVHTPGVMPIYHLVQTARETMKVVRRNLIFSAFYNVLGVLAAMTGHVGPLFAAILMPVSSLTVYASSIYGTGYLRKKPLSGAPSLRGD